MDSQHPGGHPQKEQTVVKQTSIKNIINWLAQMIKEMKSFCFFLIGCFCLSEGVPDKDLLKFNQPNYFASSTNHTNTQSIFDSNSVYKLTDTSPVFVYWLRYTSSSCSSDVISMTAKVTGICNRNVMYSCETGGIVKEQACTCSSASCVTSTTTYSPSTCSSANGLYNTGQMYQKVICFPNQAFQNYVGGESVMEG